MLSPSVPAVVCLLLVLFPPSPTLHDQFLQPSSPPPLQHNNAISFRIAAAKVGGGVSSPSSFIAFNSDADAIVLILYKAVRLPLQPVLRGLSPRIIISRLVASNPATTTTTFPLHQPLSVMEFLPAGGSN